MSEQHQQVGGQRRRRIQSTVVAPIEDLIRSQVPENRRQEFRKYLELFGYKPRSSILQVHVAGYFGRSTPLKPREAASRARAAQRYGGRTFTVVGRSHDPNFIRDLIPPQKKDSNPGYSGYLFKSKDKGRKSPHELLPLDFTPSSLDYPEDWKRMYGTPGYLVTMHVPSDFAREKNELSRRLRRKKGETDVKKPWNFLSEMEPYSYEEVRKRKTGAAVGVNAAEQP